MRDALHGLDGTQPLSPLPVRRDALSGSFSVPQQRTVPPRLPPRRRAEDVRRPVQRRRVSAAERSLQTPRLEPPHERPRRTAGSIIGLLIVLVIGAAVAFAILRRVLELYFG
ncbi:hypothetical protein MOQ72_31420 [Saccharopolyspora sp. K220]|uniref:hypothetical protein n=1 Tax=Saccharopolyspora soli TaxID=2926618 RepID=UPI001F5685D0|nr:hypothetical protein [Saccharopolyspora soli]MCI2421953.1 hypothetical protein [Saccharopolyspora soli]